MESNQCRHSVKRSWGVAEQKIAAARQKWTCALCSGVLPASFEVDHIVPLWAGGADCWQSNSQALCPTCHASKTQRESIDRRNARRAKREAAIALAREVEEKAESQRQKQRALKRKEREEARPPEAPEAPKLTDEQREELLVSDNRFLKYAYIPPPSVKRVRSWCG